jgi:hypothetical protein
VFAASPMLAAIAGEAELGPASAYRSRAPPLG